MTSYQPRYTALSGSPITNGNLSLQIPHAEFSVDRLVIISNAQTCAILEVGEAGYQVATG